MRRRLAAVVLLALALPALALASHKDPKKQLNPADGRKAASVVLKRGDFVAGWTKTPTGPDEDTHLDCPGYDPNGADLVLTGEAESNFARTGGLPMVTSFANVFRTRADAAASWSRGVKPALATCLARLFQVALRENGRRATIVRSGRIAFPKVAPRTAAFRVVMNVSVPENGGTTTVPLTFHVVALGHGRGEAGIMTIGSGNTTSLENVRVLAQVTGRRLAAANL